MSGYVLKPADGSVVFVMDWRRGYLTPGEKVLRDLGWSVQPSTGEGDLAVVEQGHDAARSWARFAGGTPGRVHIVASRIRTTDDRVLSRAIVLRIASGEGPQ